MSRFGRYAALGARVLRARVPDRLANVFLPSNQRIRALELPKPPSPPGGACSLYIAPVNFAGQGRAWARAAGMLPGIEARNMQYRGSSDLAFDADYSVSDHVFWHSHDWAARQKRAVRTGFSHVLVEAERAIFGSAFSGYLEREVAWLTRSGVHVAAVSHGTDLRLPSRHAQLDEWSPFRGAPSSWVAGLESRARRNHEILDALDIPVFVSTPELLLDRAGSTWLPVVVDPERWQTDAPPLERARPRVLHAPTNPLVKGTALIEPILQKLDAEDVIDYVRVERVPAAQMPQLYREADIVLEQFALGMYSVTSVEAMAAGRLVFAHIHDQVRDHVLSVTGRDLPVQSVTPARLEERLRDVVSRREHYRAVAAEGPAFVKAVHDGRFSATVLAPFLGVSDSARKGLGKN
ncbi:glycosyltransferase family 1 protein [Paramicrobacterium fandaimingii]|uniref:glycosyltransferase family 1 protein n=1 Tax=Paramicrobacterium fandaimingii TaxID=2708079 RepID=UPI0014222CDD|nr:glycosyltransferase family 1 protein [Microbacterium fandaimingii]